MQAPLLFGLGMLGGVIVAAPIFAVLLKRSARRARDAERRARGAERLAEIGTLTGGLAHEIKNPLSTIGLNAQLLVEDIHELPLPEDERSRVIRRIESLRRETERLRDILTDFLQFAGRVRLDPHPVDLNRLVEELADFYLPQATQHGVLLRLQPAESPALASIDQTLMKQAILNLMINATQAMAEPTTHTAMGGADAERPRELHLRIEQLTGREQGVAVHVIDTGPGIEPDKLDRIFLPYVSHKSGGSGLGLPTTRRIVEEHGGVIQVHSTPGAGTDFVISLPQAPLPE
jgi:signal transduction histidine kinase